MSKKVKSILKPISIILILLSVILLGKFAWSRYITLLNGTATANIAQFIVKVNGQTTEGFELNLAETMNSNNSVSSGYVAPGTSGSFEIVLDATESDVSVDYYLSIDASNKPTNLLLYSDSQHTTLIDLPLSNKIISIDSILISDSTQTKSTTIYWDWQYETGSNQQQIDANDIIDSKYMGEEILMPVQVKAVQKNGSGPNTYFNKSFADMVHVGDAINYDPTAGLSYEDTTIGGKGVYTAETASTGYTSAQTFNVSTDAITTWKVLGMNENGEVELFGLTPETSKLYLRGQSGYNNGINNLNNIAKIYGYGAGAIGAKSMTIEDVDKFSVYNKYNYAHAWGSQTIVGINGTNVKKEVQETSYRYAISNYKKSGISEQAYAMLTEKNYWLASRYCILDQYYCNLCIRTIKQGIVTGTRMFMSAGKIDNAVGYSVATVVTLSSDVETNGKVDGVWQLKF